MINLGINNINIKDNTKIIKSIWSHKRNINDILNFISLIVTTILCFKVGLWYRYMHN